MQKLTDAQVRARVRRFLREKGMTMTALAELLEVDVSSVSRILSKVHRPGRFFRSQAERHGVLRGDS